jgi:hypothetical protein
MENRFQNPGYGGVMELKVSERSARVQSVFRGSDLVCYG